MRRTIKQEQNLRNDLRVALRNGAAPQDCATILGISRAHVYRVMKTAKIQTYYLTRDEARVIDALRIQP